MSNRRKPKRQKRALHDLEFEEYENGGYNAIYVLDVNDSEDSYCESNSECDNELDFRPKSHCPIDDISKVSYRKVLDNYSENQSKLEPDHEYKWVDGEFKYNQGLENNILLSDHQKKMIHNSSLVQLFERFFSQEMKKYIIESTNINGYPLTENEFDVFLGIIILSTFNKRKSERDYWSTDPLLTCEPAASAMSRNKFLKIKSKLKLNKPDDKNDNDKAWRVRKVLEMFRKNLIQFGFFSTALSIDEMMVKFHGRTDLLQFMQNKPERWGCKLWGIASPQGYLFDCDIYCGKGSNIYSFDEQEKLTKCALGSRVVMLMIQKLLTMVVPKKLLQYHLYFDNFFSNPDLLVHLKNVGIKATGTVRTNRVNVKNTIDKKSKKGTSSVHHDKNSGLNFITVMDSKPVSVLSTAAGVTPLFQVERFSFDEMKRVGILFPYAFKLYNLFMGGIDLHDLHCSNLMSFIRAKKWTWPMFLRFIQSSIANATVLRNLVHEKQIGTKDIALELARYYLAKSKVNKSHKSVTVKSKKSCENFKKCATRTQRMCESCNVYSCSACFPTLHK